MTNTKIEKAVEEFHRRSNKDCYCTNEPDDDGWNIPYEGTLIDRQEEWVKQALLTAYQQGKEDERRRVLEFIEKPHLVPTTKSDIYFKILKDLKTFINQNNEK